MSILDAALSWAARGFRVFPIRPGAKDPPKGMRFTLEATTDPDKIRAWWRFEPNYNFGVACGDGLLVVDVDAAKGGLASMMLLDLPDTLTVRTPGGGLHLYFAGPDVANSVDRIAPGIDVRSHHGYVVGPGSFFADGDGSKGYSGRYVIEADMPAARAPEGFILAAGQPRARDKGAAISVDAPDDIMMAIHFLEKDAPIAIEGRGGNNTTYAVAARLIEIGVSAETAAELMAEHWNERCLPPWSGEELAQIASNAENYAQARQGSGGVTAMAEDFAGAFTLEGPPAPPAPPPPRFDKMFVFRHVTPLEEIPKQDWIMHRMLLRNEASVVMGPGGVGKSGFALALAAHGAAGRAFAGYAVPKRFKTLVYNLEDSRHMMEARLHAVCAAYGFDIREVERHVLLWPGQEMKFQVMGRDHQPCAGDIREMARLLKGNAFDAMILDPMVGLHREDENNNSAMDDVMDAVKMLARLSNVAVLLLHHTAKGVRVAGDSAAGRGAGAIVNAARVASTMYSADEDDARLYGFGEDYRARYVRVDDAKSNYSKLESKPLWLEKMSFPMPNGDTTYSMQVRTMAAQARGEAEIMARILREWLDANARTHVTTYEAAKILAGDLMFADLVTEGGTFNTLRARVELRLVEPITLDDGAVVRLDTKSEGPDKPIHRIVTIT